MLRPMPPSPVLDFLATIHAKERLPGGAFAVLDEADRATLEGLLRSYHDQGLTAALERRARTFLISYRELDKHAGVLDAAERDRLGQILGGAPEPGSPPAEPGPPPVVSWRWGTPWRWVSATGLAVLTAAGLGVGVGGYVSSHQAGPPLAVQGRARPDQQSRPEGTALQNLRQEYGPWRQLTPAGAQPRTGSPALLLLEDGSYYASGRWTVPPGVPGWQWAAANDVASVTVSGGHAAITDADGGAWVVGIDQPFVFSGAPGSVLRIDRDGMVWSLSLVRATTVRQELER
jgi:hypothetical protein